MHCFMFYMVFTYLFPEYFLIIFLLCIFSTHIFHADRKKPAHPLLSGGSVLPQPIRAAARTAAPVFLILFPRLRSGLSAKKGQRFPLRPEEKMPPCRPAPPRQSAPPAHAL
ncbi:MAG: hypothetical protein Q4F72_05485 [Desulfovibrionaceae bacterium]|nr:hypothetical protein [Desulfovibrionaceae bacterium]